MDRRYALAGLLAAPAAALALGLWAEFADLEPPALLGVAVPAIIISTLSAVALAPRLRLLAVPALGVLAGILTFGLTEGAYLALHRARGGFLNVEGYDSQAEMAAVLLGIHLGVGAVVGLAVGVGCAGLLMAARAVRWRTRTA